MATDEKKKVSFYTPVFRASFVSLAKPRPPKSGNGDPKYSVNVTLPKDDPFWKKLDRQIEACAVAKFGRVPKKLKRTRKDGDVEEIAEWKGCYSIPATSVDRPGVVRRGPDGELEEIIDKAELYSGAWYRAEVRCFAYDVEGKGVSLGLQNIMKVRDDEPFSGRQKASDAFADYLDDDDEIPNGTGAASQDEDDDPLS